MFQIASGILIFRGNLKCSCVEDKSFSDNFSSLLVNSYCCPKRLTAYMIDISFTCHHCLSNGEGCGWVFFPLSPPLVFLQETVSCMFFLVDYSRDYVPYVYNVYIYVFKSENATTKMVIKKFFLSNFGPQWSRFLHSSTTIRYR